MVILAGSGGSGATIWGVENELGRIYVKKKRLLILPRPFWTEKVVPGGPPERPRGPQNGPKMVRKEVQEAIRRKKRENFKNDDHLD